MVAGPRQAVTALVLALMVVLTGLLMPGAQRSALGASVTVSVISGSASLHNSDGSVDIVDGMPVRPGDTLRTGIDGRLVLTYFDGSTAEIEPESELVVESASIGGGGSTFITMRQVIGRTWHVVTALVRPESRYEVRTPTATAAVRGTSFEVQVEANGDTRVLTVEGAVLTSDRGNREVLVTEGHQTLVRRGQAPTTPEPIPTRTRSMRIELAEDGLIADSFGRINGIVDGRIVLQTPGARIERREAGFVLVLPADADSSVAIVGVDDAAKVILTVTSAGESVTVVEDVTSAGLIFAPADPQGHIPTTVETSLRETVARLTTPAPLPSLPPVVDSPLSRAIDGLRGALTPTAPPLPAPTIQIPVDVGAGVVGPLPLPTIADPSSPAAVSLPSVAPVPAIVALPTFAPVTPTPAPTATATPSPAPSLPTAIPSVVPTTLPIPIPSILPTATPTPSPPPTPSPTPTPSPPPSLLPSLIPSPIASLRPGL